MSVTLDDIRAALRSLDLSRRPVCVHSSLRSFGRVEGGADTVIDAFLAEGCTLLVPAQSYLYAVPPPPDQRPARNGWDYDTYPGPTDGIGRVYTPASREVDRSIGAVPAAVLARPDAVRGDHPLSSFAALGPRARSLVAGQTPDATDAPLEALVGAAGFVLLIGVGLTRMTLLHVAEHRAGREPFRRWANGPDGLPRMVRAGSCSEGFEQLAPALAPLRRELLVGASRWHLYPAAATLDTATAAIRANPRITHCGDPACARCRDAVLGGPILSTGQ
jgi:aminoglycoside 3-N-acetyltransferase